MAETRGFLDDLGRQHDALGEAAAVLPRRLADHIDEFGLVGHAGSLARRRAVRKGPVCAPLLNEAFPKRLELEGYRHCLTSTKWPAIAAAAAIAGETRWVRPLNPW